MVDLSFVSGSAHRYRYRRACLRTWRRSDGSSNGSQAGLLTRKQTLLGGAALTASRSCLDVELEIGDVVGVDHASAIGALAYFLNAQSLGCEVLRRH